MSILALLTVQTKECIMAVRMACITLTLSLSGEKNPCITRDVCNTPFRVTREMPVKSREMGDQGTQRVKFALVRPSEDIVRVS